MPNGPQMWYASLKGDQDITALATRLFNISGPRTAERAREAAEALLRVNPHLSNLAALAEGTPVVVPAVGDLTPTGADVRTVSTDVARLLAQLGTAVARVRAGVSRGAKDEIDRAQATLELVRSPALKRLADESQAARERLARVAQAAQQRADRAAALRQEHERALTAMERDAKELGGRLMGRVFQRVPRPAPPAGGGRPPAQPGRPTRPDRGPR